MVVWGKAPGRESGGFASQADNTFYESMLFCHGFKNAIAILAFIAYKYSLRNGRKINLKSQKW